MTEEHKNKIRLAHIGMPTRGNKKILTPEEKSKIKFT